MNNGDEVRGIWRQTGLLFSFLGPNRPVIYLVGEVLEADEEETEKLNRERKVQYHVSKRKYSQTLLLRSYV